MRTCFGSILLSPPASLWQPASHVTLCGRLLLYKAVKSGGNPVTKAGGPGLVLRRTLSGTGFGNEEKKNPTNCIILGDLLLTYGLNYYIEVVVNVICVNKQKQ